MKNGKLIALSSLSTALGVVFLVIGAYFPMVELSALFMASVTVMLPLTKNSYKSALLAYGATAILAFVFAVSRFHMSLLFLTFFGIHPIVNYFQMKSAKNLWFLFIIKCVWFIGVCFLMFYVFSMFIVEHELINKILPLVIIVIGTLFFIVYDYLMIRFQKMAEQIVKRLGL